MGPGSGGIVVNPAGGSGSGVALKSYCPYLITGDLNGNCKVGRDDLSIMVENWLKNAIHPKGKIGHVLMQDGYPIEVTAEMVQHIEKYVDWVRFLPSKGDFSLKGTQESYR
jgi:hypothetical protein